MMRTVFRPRLARSTSMFTAAAMGRRRPRFRAHHGWGGVGGSGILSAHFKNGGELFLGQLHPPLSSSERLPPVGVIFLSPGSFSDRPAAIVGRAARGQLIDPIRKDDVDRYRNAVSVRVTSLRSCQERANRCGLDRGQALDLSPFRSCQSPMDRGDYQLLTQL